MAVKERGGKRRNQVLNDFKETRGYWKLKQETLDCALLRTGFGSGCEPVVRYTTR
jgi:hypothetical protein